jgi:glutathione synthase
MRFAFVMDPLERVLPDKDTTFVFMLESLRRGHQVYHCEPTELFVHDTRTYARLRRAEVRHVSSSGERGKHFELFEEVTEGLDGFEVVFMRKDPPFDLSYFFTTHLLGLIDARRTVIVNHPRGLREANEKLYALNFPTVIPETFVSSDVTRLKGFMEELGGEVIIKPLAGCGGAGVFHLHRGDRNLNALLETSTDNGRQLIMAQRYLPAVRQGDKRLIVLDGRPLGAVLRVPREDEHRGNIHVGGSCVRAEITDRDREITAALAPRLRADGLYFVGLDIIGGYLTEVNVTSPTGVQEINTLDGACLEAQVIDFVEAAAAALDRSSLEPA